MVRHAKPRGRPRALEQDEELAVGCWCQEQWLTLRSARVDKGLPPEFDKHTRALSPIYEERDQVNAEFSKRAWEIRKNLREGRIQRSVASTYWERMKSDRQVRMSELIERAKRATAQIYAKSNLGPGRPPQTIILRRVRPYGAERGILRKGAHHFTTVFGKAVSERTVRAAWDRYRELLASLPE